MCVCVCASTALSDNMFIVKLFEGKISMNGNQFVKISPLRKKPAK